jgi:hypothetical protein
MKHLHFSIIAGSLFAVIGLSTPAMAYWGYHRPAHVVVVHDHRDGDDLAAAAAGGTTTGATLMAMTGGARKMGADIEVVRDQIAAYYINHEVDALLINAMEEYKESLGETAQDFDFDTLVQHFLENQ